MNRPLLVLVSLVVLAAAGCGRDSDDAARSGSKHAKPATSAGLDTADTRAAKDSIQVLVAAVKRCRAAVDSSGDDCYDVASLQRAQPAVKDLPLNDAIADGPGFVVDAIEGGEGFTVSAVIPGDGEDLIVFEEIHDGAPTLERRCGPFTVDGDTASRVRATSVAGCRSGRW